MDNALYHHGVKNQKWGKRLYQYKDGSLTPLGKLRRRMQSKSGKAQTEDNKPKEETVEERRARVLKSVDPKEIYKNKDILTTAEIDERIKRIDTEAKLKSKIPEEETGLAYLNAKMENAKKSIDTATNLYNSVDKAWKDFSSSAIGKTVLKNLGLQTEPARPEFNLDNFWRNRNTRTDQEMRDAATRLRNEATIRAEVERRAQTASDQTQAQTTQAARQGQALVDELLSNEALIDALANEVRNRR